MRGILTGGQGVTETLFPEQPTQGPSANFNNATPLRGDGSPFRDPYWFEVSPASGRCDR
jgi:hypothetical protein